MWEGSSATFGSQSISGLSTSHLILVLVSREESLPSKGLSSTYCTLLETFTTIHTLFGQIGLVKPLS